MRQAKMLDIVGLLLVFFIGVYASGVPRLIAYQGKLTNSSGVALTGDHDITFKLYTVASGGTAIWTEAHTGTNAITVTNGLFDVELGTLTDLNIAFDDTYWVELQIGTETLSPRERLVAVSYAFRAIYADTAYVVGGGAVQSDGTINGDGTAGSPLSVVLGNSIETGEITDGTIVNADISGSAAIDWSKINHPTLDNYGYWYAKDDDGTQYSLTSHDVLTFDEGSGIDVNFTGDDVLTITHKDLSPQGSVNNSGGTVIQDVSLDWTGHVTGLASVNLDSRYDNYNNWQLQANGGATTNITSGATVNFAQGGATTVSRSGNTITISSTDNVNDADHDVTNELQDLSFTGSSSPYTLDISGGSDVIFVQGSNITLSRSGNALTISSSNSGGDITAVTAGQGLTGGGTSGAVTLNVGAGTGISVSAAAVSLTNTGVSARSYTNANITVDAQGRITAASDGTVDDADASPTNEAQTLAGSGTSDISLTTAGGAGGGTITFSGSGATSVSRSGNTITISSSSSSDNIWNQDTAAQDGNSWITGKSISNFVRLVPNPPDTFTAEVGDIKSLGTGSSYGVFTYDGVCWRKVYYPPDNVTCYGGPLNVNAGNDTTICNGGGSATLTATVSGGWSPYDYDWDNDGTGDWDDSQTIVVSPSSNTTYNVQVRDIKSSIASDAVTVSVSDCYFAKAFGGTNNDDGYKVIQLSDGSYVAAGNTSSYGSGNCDFLIMKLTSSGSITWAKAVGGTSYDNLEYMIKTSDGGYLLGGCTFGFGATNADLFIVKLNSSGSFVWAKVIGGSNGEHIKSLFEASDNSIIIAGETDSWGIGAGSSANIFIVKLTSIGGYVWAKVIGGTNADVGESVIQTLDGNFALAGYTSYTGGRDLFLMKFTSAGVISWFKTVGAASTYDYGFSLVQTYDSSFVVAGYTSSYGAGSKDLFLVKFTRTGSLSWAKAVGGPSDDIGWSIVETSDSCYTVAGETSLGAGGQDLFLVKFTQTGSVSWSKSVGGTNNDYGHSLFQTLDDGYIATGWTSSYGSGNNDLFLVTFGSNGNSCLGSSISPTLTNCFPSSSSPTLNITSPTPTVSSATPTVTTISPTVTTICP